MWKRLIWAVFGLVAVCAGVGAAGAKLHWAWGDVPTWVGAVATVTALAAAGVGAYFAYRQLAALRQQVQLQIEALKLQAEQFAADRVELERRTEQELKLRQIEARRQAELVEVLVEAQTAHLDAELLYNLTTLRVDNASARPIRNIACRMDMKPYWLRAYAWGETSQAVVGNVILGRAPLEPLPVMRRAKSVTFFFPVQDERGQGVPVPTHILLNIGPDLTLAESPRPGLELVSPPMAFIVRFTDDAGSHWELADDMSLTSIEDRDDW